MGCSLLWAWELVHFSVAWDWELRLEATSAGRLGASASVIFWMEEVAKLKSLPRY
jgi:hypothetical protein